MLTLKSHDQNGPLNRLVTLVGSSINPLIATYLAVIIGISSLIGNATNDRDLGAFLSSLANPLFWGVLFSILAYMPYHRYISEMKISREEKRQFFPLSKGDATTAIIVIMGAVGALSCLMLILIRFVEFLETLG